MKKFFKLISLLSILACIGFITSCNKESSLNAQYQVIHDDADYKAYMEGINRSKIQTFNNHYGFVSLDQAELNDIKNNEEMIELLRAKGMKHPEEYVELHNGIFKSYGNLVEKHEFLKEMSNQERLSFFDNLSKRYPDVNLNSGTFLQLKQTRASKRPN
jgi:hypothetical protein